MAAPYRGGAGSRIVIGRTAAADINIAPTTPIGHVIPHSSFSIPVLDEEMTDDTLTEYVDPVPGDKGLQIADGLVLRGKMGVDHVGILARFMLGGYAVTGAAVPWAHANKATHDELPLAAILEYWDSRMNSFGGLGDQFFGCYVRQLQIQASKSSRLIDWSWTFRGTGQRALDETDELDSTPTEYTRRKLALPLCTVEVDSTASSIITGMNVSITPMVDPMLPLDGNPYAAAHDLSAIEYDVTLTGWRDDGDTLFDLDDDDPHSVELIIPEPGEATRYVSLLFPAAKIFSRVTPYNIGGKGPQPCTVRLRPGRDDTAETSLVMTVVCDIEDMDDALGDGASA